MQYLKVFQIFDAIGSFIMKLTLIFCIGKFKSTLRQFNAFIFQDPGGKGTFNYFDLANIEY